MANIPLIVDSLNLALQLEEHLFFLLQTHGLYKILRRQIPPQQICPIPFFHLIIRLLLNEKRFPLNLFLLFHFVQKLFITIPLGESVG